MTKFHAGPTYTREQQDQLDAAFAAWLAADSFAENAPDGIHTDEGRNLAALIQYNAYLTLREEFDAANESPAPYDESMWDNYRRQRAAGFVDDDAYSGRELVDQEPSSGWGL